MFNKVLSYIFVTGEEGWFAFLTLSVKVPKYLETFKLLTVVLLMPDGLYNVALVKQTVICINMACWQKWA